MYAYVKHVVCAFYIIVCCSITCTLWLISSKICICKYSSWLMADAVGYSILVSTTNLLADRPGITVQKKIIF